MTDRPYDDTIASGINTSIVHDGRRYMVQTQCSQRDAPVIESMIFHRGEALVRMTASYGDVAERFGFNGADGRHLVELQHTDLIRKIRHGMLAADGGPAPLEEDETLRLVDGSGIEVDPRQVDDPAVLALLQELGVAIDEASGRVEPAPPATPPLRKNR